jgi:hypothetical protein
VGFSGPLFGVPISFMWITPVSAAVTVAVGHAASPHRPHAAENLAAKKVPT